MLRAIVIYDNNERMNSAKAVKISSACKNSAGIFTSNAFNDLDHSLTLALPKTIEPNRIYAFKENDEFQYFMQAPTNNFVMAIASHKKVTTEELITLFININHIQIRPNIVKTSLDNVIANPLAYTGKDLLTGKLETINQETKLILIENMEKLVERAAKLEDLHEKTIQLREASEDFSDRAKKLNSCC